VLVRGAVSAADAQVERAKPDIISALFMAVRAVRDGAELS